MKKSEKSIIRAADIDKATEELNSTCNSVKNIKPPKIDPPKEAAPPPAAEETKPETATPADDTMQVD